MSLGGLDGARAGKSLFPVQINDDFIVRPVDFARASELEPSNQSVKQELAEVETLIQRQQQKRSSAVCTSAFTSRSLLIQSYDSRTPLVQCLYPLRRQDGDAFQ